MTTKTHRDYEIVRDNSRCPRFLWTVKFNGEEIGHTLTYPEAVTGAEKHWAKRQELGQ